MQCRICQGSNGRTKVGFVQMYLGGKNPWENWDGGEFQVWVGLGWRDVVEISEGFLRDECDRDAQIFPTNPACSVECHGQPSGQCFLGGTRPRNGIFGGASVQELD